MPNGSIFGIARIFLGYLLIYRQLVLCCFGNLYCSFNLSQLERNIMDKNQYVATLREAWTFLHQVELKGSSVYSMFQAMARIEAVIVDMEKPEENPKEDGNEL